MNRDNVQLIFCSFVPVGLEDYVNYFVGNFDDFIYLKWKFPHSKGPLSSSLAVYLHHKLIRDKKLLSIPAFRHSLAYFLFLPINYFLYFLQSISLLWITRSKRPVIFIGVNYFCTFCGVILKKLGRVDTVIYRVMDFFPLPPNGIYRYLNRIFYLIDSFCLKNSDFIWFTTEGHMIGRENYGYFKRDKYSFSMIPLGLNVRNFISKPEGYYNKFSLVYCGVISKYHLIDLLFEVIQDLKQDFPRIKLNMIGSGPDEAYFKDLATKMDLTENIRFHGFVEDGEFFSQLMSDNALGIAFYRDEENFMKYTEPAKVKFYLSFGVAAIVSKVPLIANELAKKRVCFAVNNDRQEIVRVIKDFISNDELRAEYKTNIGNYIKTIDIDRLLDKAFAETFGWK